MMFDRCSNFACHVTAFLSSFTSPYPEKVRHVAEKQHAIAAA